jgi:protocatechuate 3,4-dioxygenase beta subunit
MDETGRFSASSRKRYSFIVNKAYRGEIGARVDVVTGSGDVDCGYKFQSGVTYVVYASSGKGVLYTSICYRTKPLKRAQEDIVWLETSERIPAGATIFGKVNQWVRADGSQKSPLAGVAITARNSARQERKTITDAEGAYVFRGLETGVYGITPERSSTLFWGERSGEPVRQPVEAEVHDRGCAEVNFLAVADGRIRGHVFDANGSPISKVAVGIRNADAPEGGYFSTPKAASTSPNGSYEISGLPAGKYIAVVNPSGPGIDSPYLRRFYPDTAEIDKASPIEVGEAEEVSGIDFRLEHKLTSVVLEVQVVDSDGKPFAGAYTIAQHPMTVPEIAWGTTTGSDGISRLELFAERVYAISARAAIDGVFRCSGPLAVYPGRSGRITLKLGPPVPPGGQICPFSLGN